MAEKRTILVCSCEDTMPLDAGAIGAAAAARRCRPRTSSAAPRSSASAPRPQRRAAHRRLHPGGAAVLRGRGRAAPALTFANVRETAGWSADAAKAGPKMAALLAAAAEPLPDIPFVSLSSEGVALIYGRDERAIEAGKLLADHLDVTVLIARPKDLRRRASPIFRWCKGTIKSAKGHLGAFEIVVDDYAAAAPSSRGALAFGAAARRRGVALRSRARPLRRRAAVLRARSARRLSARRSGRSGRGAARGAQGARSRRHASTSRATSPSPRISARIRARRSSAATAASISARPARSRRPAIMSRSTRKSAPAAASAPRPARPAPRPTRCRRPTR